MTQISAIATLPDGDVLVGGRFTTVGGVTANNIARYSAVSGTWAALGSGVRGSNFGNPVSAILALPNGDVLVGGEFQEAGGLPARRIARYSPSSGVWSALGSGVAYLFDGTDFDGRVSALLALPNGEVLVAGSFNEAGGVPANGIARYSPTSGAWTAVGTGVTWVEGADTYAGGVLALASLQTGEAIVGGGFNHAGGISANCVARYDPVSGVWSAAGSGVTIGVGPDAVPGEVLALTVLADGSVVVGGGFDAAGGNAATNLARYFPLTNQWSVVGAAVGVGSLDGPVYALCPLADGTVAVGGTFCVIGNINNLPCKIARYNPNTNTYHSIGKLLTGLPDFDGGTNVSAIAKAGSGDILVGGYFDFAGGEPAASIAQYSLGSAAPHIAAQPATMTVCLAGTAEYRVTAFGTGELSYTWQIRTAPDTWLLLTDAFQTLPCGATAQAVPAHSATSGIRIRGCPGALSPPQEFQIRCVVSDDCGSVSSEVALYRVCAADFSCSGGTTIDDLFLFLNAWFTGLPDADIDGNGASSPTIDDLFLFLNAWFTGC